ncbi:glycosyltransferase [Bosea sp. (in: a-proteobacteria)]|uniref:glycosyltransferase n=1 Tax=Bosea sp. (in: a-proteobacteria) TaxID=1871050 RepID=UPI00260CAEAC|nr:glycosyltransferase [Bosea sp. (in: a-proteobacteria)]MCO5090663.1 glycosyltransferase [Bosea sp. (in: a-proteobacteria)]
MVAMTRPPRATDAPVAPLSDKESALWLEEFQAAHGRKPRVLHIGNIANNAYNNAKIQNRYGIEADVLCFDYYHIMACPEWEDADFAGEIADQHYPDWWSVELRGFRRPRWFAQGPFDACVRYLLARASDAPGQRWLWRWLELERWLLCRRGRARSFVVDRIEKSTGRPIRYVTDPANAVLMGYLAGKLAKLRRLRRLLPSGLFASLNGRLTRLGAAARTADIARDGARHQVRAGSYRGRVESAIASALAAVKPHDPMPSLEWFYNWWYHPYLKLLLSKYDVVQCYATYTAMPFIIAHPFVAYEHGTIRKIPFEDTDEGRMCLASYKSAACVLVTNTDNIDASRAMKLEPGRVIYLPHAFDSDKLLRFRAHAQVALAPQRPVSFLTPTRQHWVDQDPGWAKGNDRVFRALALVRQSGRHCLLKAVAWGSDLEASRGLAAELGVADMVEWVAPMKKRALWASYLAAHAVIDQFVVPAMGGVTFEAMMLGRRVISAIDASQAAEFFGAAPPIYNCREPAEIAAAMIRVIDDPADEAGDGDGNMDWMSRYHSAERIVTLQLAAYRRLAADGRGMASL